MEEPRRQTIEYKFLRQNTHHPVPRMRFSFSVYLTIFHISFIILYAFFATYQVQNGGGNGAAGTALFPMFMDVHSMLFVGFGFLMAFLKRYGYGSIGFNFLLAAFVIEWALLVRGWLEAGMQGGGMFTISLKTILAADYCAAAVLISFAAIVGKASLSQLVVMAAVEVVLQSLNQFIATSFLQVYDVGQSIFVHLFGAFFGLAVAKMLQGNREIESTKESSHYHSDLFAMIGTIFLWIYWPSFNAALAKDEGQSRAIVNTLLAIISSCIATFVVSLFVGRGRINMTHVQHATLAGGVAVGAVADMVIEPFGAMTIGTVAGVIATIGYQYLTPLLNSGFVHDTCGVNSVHGLPAILSGIASAIVAATANRAKYNGDRLYVFYPSLTPMSNSTEYQQYNLGSTPYAPGGLGRAPTQQAGYQIAAMAMTIGFAIFGGILTGQLMRIPLVERIDELEEMFDDEPHWHTPEDYSLKLTEVRVQQRGDGAEEEMQEKRTLNTTST